MSCSTRAWIAAASIGAIEALKDQGICTWIYAQRSIQQHAKNNIRSSSSSSSSSSTSQAKKICVPSYSDLFNKLGDDDKLKKYEESLRTVMLVIPLLI
ncbi:2-nonaprenyl-3-methyl-6-methoxy-1,4-benzoquinol hydroxylase [Gossypium australe]|uniref:2-nonaprenyl-3-methyl-6-methoxy-1,4-benzoquinol hydroxylase n=1 Tax=Gossypium australe TaxID=47621 RepID=A0A5B6U4D6_9ROSI|nr:2-nonaprenyl-3-methyl-6-methoxy-1,4-benzoquinol hydroxylase [Gossypium australe]